MASLDVATAEPAEATLAPAEAMVACAAVRTELFDAVLVAPVALPALVAVWASDTTKLVGATATLPMATPMLAAEATAEESVGVTGGVRQRGRQGEAHDRPRHHRARAERGGLRAARLRRPTC